MNIGQLVRIGGRTRLSPTFSLVGLTGIVIPTAPGAPPGCVTVWVNWQEAGYENLDELPPAVNVPELHLEPITAEPEEEAPKTPHLQSVAPVGQDASTREYSQAPQKPQNEKTHIEPPKDEPQDDEPRPKLRLV